MLPAWEPVADVLRRDGYSVHTGLLAAEDFSVPQASSRAILTPPIPPSMHRGLRGRPTKPQPAPRAAPSWTRPGRYRGKKLDRP